VQLFHTVVTHIHTVWTHMHHATAQWPWATIAAFAAVAVALWTALSGVRERRQQLRQTAVIEVWSRSNEWNTAAGEFLGTIRRYLEGTVGADVVNGQALKTTSDAATQMDRSMKAAKMTCTDFQLVAGLSETERKLADLLKIFGGPHPAESQDQQRQRLQGNIETGLAVMGEFNTSVQAFLGRGFELYRLRRGLRFRWSAWRAGRRQKHRLTRPPFAGAARQPS
jgi:hypothetical protein